MSYTELLPGMGLMMRLPVPVRECIQITHSLKKEITGMR
ncbi:hypothetical protein SDC9_206279 [bioreactor metagenome]|uniref:Uncharacterized protein n=1 Tax=bioreactor metagenome TaxID=1076179 RepID=A0A645J625_9ZZZZ